MNRKVFSGVVHPGANPKRPQRRWTCVSTGNTSRPIEKRRTHEAVFTPMPLIRVSSSITSSLLIPFRDERLYLPKRSLTARSVALMRGDFWFAIPPARMAVIIPRSGASATFCHGPYFFRSRLYARWLFLSFVFCERMVAISMSNGRGSLAACTGVPNADSRIFATHEILERRLFSSRGATSA